MDVEAALAYRDLMVSDHTDAGQQAWLASKGIDLIRGTAGSQVLASSRLATRASPQRTLCWRPAPTESYRLSPACAS